MEKTFNKTNEHVIIPILLSCTLVSLTFLIYYINEYSLQSQEIIDYYLMTTKEYADYKNQVFILMVSFLSIILLQLLAIKLKNRWLYLLLIGINIPLFFMVP